MVHYQRKGLLRIVEQAGFASTAICSLINSFFLPNRFLFYVIPFLCYGKTRSITYQCYRFVDASRMYRYALYRRQIHTKSTRGHTLKFRNQHINKRISVVCSLHILVRYVSPTTDTLGPSCAATTVRESFVFSMSLNFDRYN